LPDKPGSYSSYGLYTGASGGLRFYIGYSTSWVASPDAGTGIWDGKWHHVAGTYDGSAVKLYVDGVQVGGAGSTTLDIYYYFGTGNLFIGAYTATSHLFSGIIDEVRIWGTALTATQLNDMTPPTLTKSLSGTLGLAGWYTSDVTVTLTGSDTGSGLNRVEYSFDGTTWTTYTAPFTISTEGTTTVHHRAYDNAGNIYILPSQDIKIDTVPPTVTPIGTPTYILNQPGATVSATVTDATSGPAASPVTVSVPTTAVGTFSVLVTGYDVAGNSSAVSCSYNVIYGFSGLLPPYVAPPKAFKIGSSIPLKWQYTDSADNVVDSSLANPRVRIVLVGVVPPVTDDPIDVGDPGLSGLRYDSTTNMWIFNWQTKEFTAGTYWIWITSGLTGQINGPFPILLR
jgi:hypothetical protein